MDPESLLQELPICEMPHDFQDPLDDYEYGSKKWIKAQKKLVKYLDMEAESIVWRCRCMYLYNDLY